MEQYAAFYLAGRVRASRGWPRWWRHLVTEEPIKRLARVSLQVISCY